MNDNNQIVPFPLPIYLSTFFANQLTTEVETLIDGSDVKAFHIRKKSELGKFILRRLKPTYKKPKIQEGITLYLSVENRKGERDKKQVDKRYSFVEFDEQGIKEITNFLKPIFEMTLISWCNGAQYINELKENVKGVRNKAIVEFCKKNGVTYTNQNIDAWQKLIYRDKKTDKPLLHRLL
ncbi:MAG: hypothetical protein HRT69_10875 [Flavobacteriaceae bacterium]|nr:hypothetical protein [Flavobacteriaceae bacterium]